MNKKEINSFGDFADEVFSLAFNGVWNGFGFLIFLFVIGLPIAVAQVGIEESNPIVLLFGLSVTVYVFYNLFFGGE